MDQCMNCTVRGDIDACMKTPCSQHESWYAQTLKAQQRTWVGLMDEDIERGCNSSWVDRQAFESAVWWAEAKLKEKNNGT